MVALDRAIRNNDKASLALLEPHLNRFLAFIDRFPSTVAIKVAAAARGWSIEPFSNPPGDADRAAHDEFKAWLTDEIPQVIQDCARLP